MKTIYKIMLGALGVIVITNPASGAVILDWLEIGFKLIAQYASPVNFLASGVLVVCIGYLIWDGRERTHVPKKGKKTSKANLEYEV